MIVIYKDICFDSLLSIEKHTDTHGNCVRSYFVCDDGKIQKYQQHLTSAFGLFFRIFCSKCTQKSKSLKRSKLLKRCTYNSADVGVGLKLCYHHDLFYAFESITGKTEPMCLNHADDAFSFV